MGPLTIDAEIDVRTNAFKCMDCFVAVLKTYSQRVTAGEHTADTPLVAAPTSAPGLLRWAVGSIAAAAGATPKGECLPASLLCVLSVGGEGMRTRGRVSRTDPESVGGAAAAPGSGVGAGGGASSSVEMDATLGSSSGSSGSPAAAAAVVASEAAGTVRVSAGEAARGAGGAEEQGERDGDGWDDDEDDELAAQLAAEEEQVHCPTDPSECV